MYTNVKLKLPVLVGPISAIQPVNHPMKLTFPGCIKKLALGSPWGNYFTPGVVRSQHTEYQKCTDIALSGYQFTKKNIVRERLLKT